MGDFLLNPHHETELHKRQALLSQGNISRESQGPYRQVIHPVKRQAQLTITAWGSEELYVSDSPRRVHICWRQLQEVSSINIFEK